MKNKLLSALLLLSVLGLAGCASDKAVKQEPAVQDQTSGAEAAGAGAAAGAEGTALKGQSAADLQNKRRVYFAFDSSAIDEESRAVIEAQATYLAANPKVKVVLEGHTDERGTREYNLALGERRAQAVERMMRTLGVAADRIKATSYGEEKPVATGHDESSWHLNRRVEILY